MGFRPTGLQWSNQRGVERTGKQRELNSLVLRLGELKVCFAKAKSKAVPSSLNYQWRRPRDDGRRPGPRRSCPEVMRGPWRAGEVSGPLPTKALRVRECDRWRILYLSQLTSALRKPFIAGASGGPTAARTLQNLLLSYSPAVHGIVAWGEIVPCFGVTKEWKPFGS